MTVHTEHDKNIATVFYNELFSYFSDIDSDKTPSNLAFSVHARKICSNFSVAFCVLEPLVGTRATKIGMLHNVTQCIE